ncbi:DUF5064 family protein [Pseudomonas sp. MAP12]|uniref:DUF5064 family protein n=1 Tax=Geopseudomonas aromaticivorans TaxID=2849492 RepID=A0ABS6N247_9GAMM|nr:DUF5064 family protein [Pseudomonas aromaticivorans]MBV2134734.1 DUF5064 family protein [Pseudomonas aromaticivorans]
MFEPGHVHMTNPVGSFGLPPYNIDGYYEVRTGGKDGPFVHFRMVGQIDGKPFEEEFDMSHDTVFNFASVMGKLAVKHGMPPNNSPVMRNHKDYDAVFEDIRAKLKVAVGGPLSAHDPNRDA